MHTYKAPALPREFIRKRLHSLTGLFITLYLIEHLLVNSQAALFFGEYGAGFIRAVNHIHELPYLPAIELFLLGVPILLHMVLGIEYLRTSRPNTYLKDGKTPYLPEYARNHAYTWQRITSWILLFALTAHVIHMRFIEYPASTRAGTQTLYLAKVYDDPGLKPLANRIGFQVISGKDIQQAKEALSEDSSTGNREDQSIASTIRELREIFKQGREGKSSSGLRTQELADQERWLKTVESQKLNEGQVLVQANNFGTVTLLMLRNTFKSPLMIALYTLFLLAACFHGFNGLWTFMITWGVTLSERAQRTMRRISIFLMLLVGFWGLAAIWGTYWINLK